jgi:UDP-glucose 4-epimerase
MKSVGAKSLQGRNVLVTGGAGFIGSHFVEELLSREVGHVVVVDSFYLGTENNLDLASLNKGDLTVYRIDASDFLAISEVIRRHKIQTVFDFATIPLPTSLEFPHWAVHTNTRIATTLVELARLNLVEDVVHISSSEVYGTARYTPMDENHPLLPLTPYAASKASGDMIIDSYRHTFGIDAMIIRPFNNFGPRQNLGSYAGVIPIAIQRMLTGIEIEIFGDGEQTRDFIFVRETASFIADIYCQNPALGYINLATGVETSVNELVASIANILQLPLKVVHLDPRPGDVRQHLAGIDQLRKTLGRVPRPISLDDLAETVEWYRKRFR